MRAVRRWVAGSIATLTPSPSPVASCSVTGSFSATLPVSTGVNTVVLLAGVNIGQQSNWYRNAATRIVSVTGAEHLDAALAHLGDPRLQRESREHYPRPDRLAVGRQDDGDGQDEDDAEQTVDDIHRRLLPHLP